MSEKPRRTLADELGPYLDADEAREIETLAGRLFAERPSPALGFRVELRKRVAGMADDARPRAAGPLRLRTAILAYAGAGGLLLAFAALGVAGAGPLAP